MVIPTVSETNPNAVVKVHKREEWESYSNAKKDQMELPFRGLTKIMQKLGQKGANLMPLSKQEQLVLAKTVNHLTSC